MNQCYLDGVLAGRVVEVPVVLGQLQGAGDPETMTLSTNVSVIKPISLLLPVEQDVVELHDVPVPTPPLALEGELEGDLLARDGVLALHHDQVLL